MPSYYKAVSRPDRCPRNCHDREPGTHVNDRVEVNRRASYVFKDADSGLNHGFASGFSGDTSLITVDSACVRTFR